MQFEKAKKLINSTHLEMSSTLSRHMSQAESFNQTVNFPISSSSSPPFPFIDESKQKGRACQKIIRRQLCHLPLTDKIRRFRSLLTEGSVLSVKNLLDIGSMGGVICK